MRKGLNLARRWRQRTGQHGVSITLLPLNLPDHAVATIMQQAQWVARKMKRSDFATIAECPPALAAAVNKMPGLSCVLATKNFGGNGNAIVVNDKRVDDVHFSDYPITFRANSGEEFTLHMARVRCTKEGVKIAVDGIHAPSRGRYKTSAPDGARDHVFQEIAKRAPSGINVRLVAGDTNWGVGDVVKSLHKINSRWRHLGGAGVEQVYGLGAVRLGQSGMKYGRISDHETTAKVKVGAMK